MSAMDYYRTLNYFDKPNFSLEEVDVGLEEGKSIKELFSKIIEKAKNLLKRIKEFVTGIGKKIYQGIRFILGKLIKRKDLTAKQLKLLSKADRLTLWKQVLIGPNGRTVHFIEDSGDIVDFKEYQKTWKAAKTSFLKAIKDKTDGFEMDFTTSMQLQRLAQRVKYGLNVHDEDSFRKVKLDQLEKLFDVRTLEIMNSELSTLEKDMGELSTISIKLNKEITEIYGDGNDSSRYQEAVKLLSMNNNLATITQAKLQYYHAVIGIHRILSQELKTGFCFSEPLPSGTKLYHISTNSKLGDELHPQYPKSGDFKTLAKKHGDMTGDMYLSVSDQILPKRISFSPDVEGCANGASFYANQAMILEELNGKKTEGGILSYDVYLYEGIPDKETQHIKPEYVKQTVADYNASREICVTTTTKIKRVGKIRIWLDTNSPIEYKSNLGTTNKGLGKFIKYEIIEKY